MTQREVAEVLARGLVAGYGPGLEVDLCPLTDGGDGSAQLFKDMGGECRTQSVIDAWGRPHAADWVVYHHVAFIESALATPYVKPGDRPSGSAAQTTSYGTGTLIAEALRDPQIREIWVGLGGTGSVDAGMGLLAALGSVCWNASGREIPCAIEYAGDVARLSLPELGKPLVGLVDVDAPLLGPTGAVRRFGPQKGIQGQEMRNLEQQWRKFAQVAGPECIDTPGAGAAGGMGFALACLGGVLRPGSQWCADWVHLGERMKDADLVVTGEGRLDEQSLMGKVPSVVLELARSAAKPVVVVAGEVLANVAPFYSQGAWLVLSVARGPVSPRRAIMRTGEHLFLTGEMIGRMLHGPRGTAW